MGGHIDCYMDCSLSPYFSGYKSRFWKQTPWSLPAKAAYGKFDSERAKKYHGMENIQVPDFFPPVTLLPQRALCYIKAAFSPSIFEQTWQALMHALWNPPQTNITVPSALASKLSKLGLFTESEVEGIMKAAAEKEWKDKLMENTKMALDQGAFGAPWFWVRNWEAKEEPFFGSDRYGQP